MRKLIAVLLLISSLGFAQGFKGKVGFKGKIGIKGGVAGGVAPTTVTYATKVCDGSGGGSTAAACTLSGTPTAGNAVVGVIWMTSGTSISSISDGGSSYTTQPVYANSTNFSSQVFYTCNYAGSGAALAITMSGSASWYVGGVVATGNSTAGCIDVYTKNQSTSGGTAYTGTSATTTNAHDLLIGLATNNAGGVYTAGTDGQGNTMVKQVDKNGVVGIETFNEVSALAFTVAFTGPSSTWNLETVGVK